MKRALPLQHFCRQVQSVALMLTFLHVKDLFYLQNVGLRANLESIITTEGNLTTGELRHSDTLSSTQIKAKCK